MPACFSMNVSPVESCLSQSKGIAACFALTVRLNAHPYNNISPVVVYDAENAKAEKQRQDESVRQQELEFEQRKIKAQEEADANRRRTLRPGGWPYQPMYQ